MEEGAKPGGEHPGGVFGDDRGGMVVVTGRGMLKRGDFEAGRKHCLAISHCWLGGCSTRSLSKKLSLKVNNVGKFLDYVSGIGPLTGGCKYNSRAPRGMIATAFHVNSEIN